MKDVDAIEIDGVRFRLLENTVHISGTGCGVDVPIETLAQFVDWYRTPAMMKHIKRTIWRREEE